MSFTLMRYKNGKPVTLRVCIWDAFKGVPNAKPTKPKPCKCCNKVHPKEDNTATAITDAKKTEDRNTKSEGKEGTTNAKPGAEHSHSTKEEETFTAEDDKMMIEMKAAQKPWKEIMAVLGKTSVSQLKNHWKTIDPETNNTNEPTEKVDAGVDNDKKKTKEDKETWIAKQKAEGQARKAKEKEDAKAAESQKADSSTPAADAEAGAKPNTTETANDMKTFANRYDKHKWMAAASKHFDRTGQRITPIMARKLAEGSKPS